MSTYFDSPIYAYLSDASKKFSVPALINAHSRLSGLQVNKGNISYEDILQTLRISLTGISAGEKIDEDLDAYGALLYEAILTPVFSNPVQHMSKPLLQMRRELVGNESTFIQAIVKVLKAHGSAADCHASIEEFEREASAVVVTTTPVAEPPRGPPPGSWTPSVNPDGFSHPNSQAPPANRQLSYPGMPQPQYPPQHYPPSQHPGYGRPAPAGYPQPGVPVNRSYPPVVAPKVHQEDPNGYVTEMEKHDPIMRLLAQIRKYGMDILFPQSIHDKVSIHIYISLCNNYIIYIFLFYGLG